MLLPSPKSIALLLGILVVVALTAACHKTTFEQAQARAEAANPHWLSIDLNTADKRHTYKESEPVMFTVAYSSAVGKYYKAEIAEGGSTVAATDQLHISDGREMPLNIHGIVCCFSKVIGLNDDPYIYRPTLQVYLKPGTYEFYVTTHRIFPWDITSSVYEPSEWETASNLMKIRVEADPGWQERALAKIQANPGDGAMCSLLFALDIPAATARKLYNLRNGIRCRPFVLLASGFNDSEYPAALRGLDDIVHSPTYGVKDVDVSLILSMRNAKLHPELRHPPVGHAAYESWEKANHPTFVASQKELARELCSVLPAKMPDAFQATRQTIDRMTAQDDMHDSTCAEIAAATPPSGGRR